MNSEHTQYLFVSGAYYAAVRSVAEGEPGYTIDEEMFGGSGGKVKTESFSRTHEPCPGRLITVRGIFVRHEKNKRRVDIARIYFHFVPLLSLNARGLVCYNYDSKKFLMRGAS